MIIEFWGGPRDGERIELPDDTEGVPLRIWLGPPQDLYRAQYASAGRMHHGAFVYRYVPKEEK